MKILDAYPKDIYARVEFSLADIKKIAGFIERAAETAHRIVFPVTDDPVIKAETDYVRDIFYPELKKFIKEIEK